MREVEDLDLYIRTSLSQPVLSRRAGSNRNSPTGFAESGSAYTGTVSGVARPQRLPPNRLASSSKPIVPGDGNGSARTTENQEASSNPASSNLIEQSSQLTATG